MDFLKKDSKCETPSRDFEFSALAEAINYRKNIVALFASELTGDVLEVGAGVGQILEVISTACRPKSCTAVEPDENFANALKMKFPRFSIICGSISDLGSDKKFDSIVAINVLEHIENDLQELKSWKSHLKQSIGSACILVPARPELYSKIDADFGHFRRYTKHELKQKLIDAGFTIKSIGYFNFVGYFLWLINFRILGRRYFNINSVRAFDRTIFPVCNKIENLLNFCPIGQSLIAIAKV